MHDHQHHQAPAHGRTAPGASLNRLALSATIHCLSGCAIGEVLGMVIGTALHWNNAATIVLSIALAFISGYALTMLPLLRSGMAFGAAAAPPTLILDERACAARKLAALRCHRTQLAGDALDLLSDEEARRLLGVEYFRCANVGSKEDAFIERLAAPPALRRHLRPEAG